MWVAERLERALHDCFGSVVRQMDRHLASLIEEATRRSRQLRSGREVQGAESPLFRREPSTPGVGARNAWGAVAEARSNYAWMNCVHGDPAPPKVGRERERGEQVP